MSHHTSTELKAMTKEDLLKQAARLGLHGLSQHTKAKIIAEIVKSEKAHARKQHNKAAAETPVAANCKAVAVPVNEREVIPPSRTVSPSTPAASSRVSEILSDIRSAHVSGARVAQIAESDQQVIDAVVARLTPAERIRVCFGETGGRSAIG